MVTVALLQWQPAVVDFAAAGGAAFGTSQCWTSAIRLTLHSVERNTSHDADGWAMSSN